MTQGVPRHGYSFAYPELFAKVPASLKSKN
jgi:hypothetical protein